MPKFHVLVTQEVRRLGEVEVEVSPDGYLGLDLLRRANLKAQALAKESPDQVKWLITNTEECSHAEEIKEDKDA